jgi:hemoglobin
VAETFFERVGGESFFDDLVGAFYGVVESDPVLRPLYPEDLNDSRRHLSLFLAQYWGGPRTYQNERGHPRLRMRHAPFAITPEARDHWLAAMEHALAAVRDRLDEADFIELRDYLAVVAGQLRNA